MESGGLSRKDGIVKVRYEENDEASVHINSEGSVLFSSCLDPGGRVVFP